MNYEKAQNFQFSGKDVLVKNGHVPGCPISVHFQVRETSTFVDPDAGVIAEVSHGYDHSIPSNFGWRVQFECEEEALIAYRAPGGVFWIRDARPPDGYIAVPPELDLDEWVTDEAQIYLWEGM